MVVGTRKRQLCAKGARPAITRFVPGREGTGWTDRIDSVVNYLDKNDFCILDHHYGLWYDLRRTDHERIRRADGDVWAPFYEQAFARSGQGTAWDGLSRYDLTKPNEWYWTRLNEFAEEGAKKGILLFNQNYFQHNILEAGAHWVDCPWRPVNNVNGTDFPNLCLSQATSAYSWPSSSTTSTTPYCDRCTNNIYANASTN